MADAGDFYATQGPMSRLPAGVTPDDVPDDLAGMRTVDGRLVEAAVEA